MQSIAVLATIALTGGALACAQNVRPDGKGDPIREEGERNPRTPPIFPVQRDARQAPIVYHGGPVLSNPTLYFIWYGTWTASDQNILETLASHIGGSPYANILTTYYDFTGQPILNTMNYGGSTTDNYSLGRTLSDFSVQTIVETALNNKSLPVDNYGIYYVLAASDVSETSGFCAKYCGWHKNVVIGASHTNIVFVGNGEHCPDACLTQAVSPNDDTGADSAASVIAHETDESITDPYGTAWFDSKGNEIADKCAYTYGETTTLPNGSLSNMQLGGLNYLIQQDWLNVGPGRCVKAH